ncbi:MAG: hypothetical protein U0X76_00120 [Bacteroidia bacterium]
MDGKNKILKYAAIDIGSNAVRLLLCNAAEEHGVVHFKKGELDQNSITSVKMFLKAEKF